MKLRKLWSTLLLLFIGSFSIAEATETKGFLTPEEIALFYKQGYLLKKQCLSKVEIESLNANVTQVIDQALNEIQKFTDISLQDEEQKLLLNGSRVIFKQRADQTLSIARINGVCGMQPALLSTLRSEKMINTFFELLQTRDLEHLIAQLHPKMPGDGIAFPRHRDIQFRKSFDPEWQDVLGNGSYAICIIPIDPMTQENGGLWIDKNNYPEPQGMEEDLLAINAEPGDLLFMHPHLFHGSGPNLSPTASRRTLLTGFCAFGANHKQYPGADVNIHLTLMPDGTIATEPAPWSQVTSLLDANH